MRTAPSVRARADRGWAAALAAGGINLLLFGALAWVNRPAAGRPEREEEWTFREVVLFAPELREERPPAERTVGMAMPQPRPAPAPLEAAVAAETFAPRLPDAGPAAVPIPEVPAPPPAAAAGPAGALEASSVDRPPRKVYGPLPAYPYWARAQAAEGTVTLHFRVDSEGNVGDVRIRAIEGDDRFGELARRAVSEWRFEPAMFRGRPVAVWCVQRIRFRLED